MIKFIFKDTHRVMEKEKAFEIFEDLKTMEEDTGEILKEYTLDCTYYYFSRFINRVEDGIIYTEDVTFALRNGCHSIVKDFICIQLQKLEKMTLREAIQYTDVHSNASGNYVETRRATLSDDPDLLNYYAPWLIRDYPALPGPVSDEPTLFGEPIPWDVLRELINAKTIFVLLHLCKAVEDWYLSVGKKILKNKHVKELGGSKHRCTRVDGVPHSVLGPDGKRLPASIQFDRNETLKEWYHHGILSRKVEDGPAYEEGPSFAYYVNGRPVNGVCSSTGLVIPHTRIYEDGYIYDSYDDHVLKIEEYAQDPWNKELPKHCKCKKMECKHAFDILDNVNHSKLYMPVEIVKYLCEKIVEVPGHALQKPLLQHIEYIYFYLHLVERKDGISQELENKVDEIVKEYLAKGPAEWED